MTEIITSANVTSFVRSLVNEASAKFWTDNDITLYIKFGMQMVVNKYWYALIPRDLKVVKASLVASTPYVAMPGASIPADTFTGSGTDDLTYSGAYGHRADLTYEVEIDGTGTPNTFKWSKDGGSTYEATTVDITGSAQDLDNGVIITFAATTGHTSADKWVSACVSTKAAKIVRIEEASDRDLLRYIESDVVWQYSEYDDGSASTNYLNVWYLENKSLVEDFPEALRPLIAIEAIIFAMSADKGVTADVFALQRRFEDSATTFLATESVYEPAIMGDNEINRAYTVSDPVAWGYRDGKIYLYKAYDES